MTSRRAPTLPPALPGTTPETQGKIDQSVAILRRTMHLRRTGERLILHVMLAVSLLGALIGASTTGDVGLNVCRALLMLGAGAGVVGVGFLIAAKIVERRAARLWNASKNVRGWS